MTHQCATVLISGAGFAGLTAATMLSLRGIPCLAVERRPALSEHPRAHGLNLRTLELFRQVSGLESDLLRASRAAPDDSTVLIAESVTGIPIKTLSRPGGFDMRSLSPAVMCSAGQDRIEPILLRHARALGVDVHFSTEFLSFSQHKEGVRAVLRDATSGKESVVNADYLIGADGSGSTIRKSLGVAMDGLDGISYAVSILFEADLSVAMAGRGFLLCYLRNSEFTGAFVSCDDPNRGQINVEYDAAREDISDFDTARCEHIVRVALGQPELDVRILSILPWRMSALLAQRMREGRVFLAGDAAHIMPPVGGLAGQVAIQDAVDLAWKLALVINDQAGPSLLDTYDLERRPVAQLAIARATENYVERIREDRANLTNALGCASNLDVVMSYRYRSPAITLEESDDGLPTDDALRPSGRPGTRLAHVNLIRDGVQISTHDLVGHGLVLLAGLAGSDWIHAAAMIARRSSIPLTAFQIGVDLMDPTEVFLRRTGLQADGALLVRPDGFIAWRSLSAVVDPFEKLVGGIERALCCALKWTSDLGPELATLNSVQPGMICREVIIARPLRDRQFGNEMPARTKMSS
jgi:putative polyketide hydroxylase